VSRGVALGGSTPPRPFVEDAIARLFGIYAELPSQLPRRERAARGPTALLAGVLANALEDAGVVRLRRFQAVPPATAYGRRAARIGPGRRATARAWLTGTLDDQVVVSVQMVCDALGLDAG
jgi:hypothetical protein